ncbi:xylulokinase [Pararhodobacter sp.]|uniref:xylulokinase n=1 Tax=Pararhodobacter sp. TaxID=2127056 RepID=UPI002FDEDA68
MSESFLMGVDVGAGSQKTTIIDSDGNVRGTAAWPVRTHAPKPGWSEQDPEDWWAALCRTAPAALREAGIRSDQIAGIAFSAGAHTPVLTDRSGVVLRPAILWSDVRSGAEAAELASRHGEEILRLGLNHPQPTWTQSQLLWLMRHEPEVMEKAARLYVAKDWLRGRLTGSWETDHTEAVGTLLFDGRAGAWSPRLCEMIGLDMALLPPVVLPTDVVGRVRRDAAEATGLAEGTPVICGSSDTSVETFGAGAIHAGDGTVKLATAATVSVVGTAPLIDATLINYPFAVPKLWYTMGATNSCASAHRWLAETFYADAAGTASEQFAVMDAMADEVPAGASGLIFHPYLQGERSPHWDPRLRADFIGITFGHDRRHFVRALYEGVAFSLRDVLGQLQDKGLTMREATIIGGGSRSLLWRQIVADVLAMPICVPRVADASFGAALVAGIGAGVFADATEAVGRTVHIEYRHEPDRARSAFYAEMHAVYRDAARAMQPISHRLGQLAEGN